MKAPKTKHPHPFNELLNRRLASYAGAAAAAGAGLLGWAPSAGAQVVYTPTHVVIGFLGSYALDLNNDGTTDFVLRNEAQANCSTLFSSLLAFPVAGNAVEGMKLRDRNLANALKPGATIGSNQNFVKQYPLLGAVIDSPGGGQYSGAWTNVVNRYLGLKFQINGEAHFGWARMSVHFSMTRRLQAVLTGYAYETQANTPILAGEEKGMLVGLHGEARIGGGNGAHANRIAPRALQPPSLGALALGAQGLALWRRDPQEARRESESQG